MVRALLVSYAGPLYEVLRASDNTTKAVPLLLAGASDAWLMMMTGRLEPAKDGALVAGGYANSRVQDEFCAGTDCLVTMLFDQTANGNDLMVFGANDSYAGRQDRAANASMDR